MKEFFKDVLISIESTEAELVSNLYEKLSSLIESPEDIAIKCLRKPTLPYISGYAVTKALKNNNVKCNEYISVISIGIHISDEEKESVLYDISYLNARDKVGLTWPNEIVVILSDLVLSVFENTISSEHHMKLLMQSASASRVGLRTLRRIVEEKVSKCDATKYLCCSCQVCGSNRMSGICIYLINTLFNIGANNFTMLLNRKENAKKLV